MSAAITELSAARAARPAPDPLFWPAGEPAGGRPTLEPAAGRPGDGSPADDRPAAGAAFELWGVVRWAVHRLWPARESRP